MNPQVFRIFKFFALGAILACAGFSGLAFAQNTTINVRTGTHAEYSRLVFDWGTKTGYQLTKPKSGTLDIQFKSAATLNITKAKANKVRNILGLETLSDNPARVKVTIPDDSRYRSFYAGNKIVLDVYNPPGSKPSAPEKIAEAPKAKPATTPSVPPPSKTSPKPVAKQPPEITAEINKKPETESGIPEIKKVIAAAVPTVEEDSLNRSAEKRLQGANLVTISSSRSVGLAVFERGGKIWVVNDKEDLLVTPKVSGSDAERLKPLETLDLKSAKAFLLNNLPGSALRTQGGGLLWKIIISPDGAPVADKNTPVEPRRENITDGETRSGRIIWPFEEPSAIIDVTDPVTGALLKVVTAKSAKDFSGPARSFVDFDVLPSSAGLVISPKTQDLKIRIISTGVEITGPEGLAILSQNRIEANKPSAPQAKTDDKTPQTPRIFDFKNWQLGGLDAIAENHTIILSGINELPKNAKDEAFMTLAKMYLSNAMGAESLGFLSLVARNNPDISKTAEFRAIRGAARAIDYKTLEAFADLSVKDLDAFEEIGFWKAYALADLGDWRQAIEVMPKTAAVLYSYPNLVLNRVGLVAAEVALRSGNTGLAGEILSLIEENLDELNDPQEAALKYLKGETARQKGDLDKTKEYWEELVTGPDDLYRAKAGLAHTRLLVDEGDLPPGKAIDNLERLRYAWRGDELEGQINYWLGRTYFEARQFVKGLNIMREAAALAAGTNLGSRITNEMSDIFTHLYLSDELNNVTPLDAVALYEQFTELVPSGEEGDRIVERLADRLAQADLLGRAGNLLNYQLTHRLDGLNAYNVGTKLAAIRLLDNKPDEALAALKIAGEKLQTLPQEMQTPDKYQAVSLLRARALSRQGRSDQAIALLEGLKPNPTINRLRADIAWTAGYWDDAAAALDDVILDQNISLTRPLSDDHSTLILHRAVALNLASDRIALANMREKYADAMAQTQKARLFDVITRARQNAALADRDTLLGVMSEVDLFSDFLNSYKAAAEPVN